MSSDIGAFEAKNRFSHLLERVRGGETFTITHRGAPIAKLSPVHSEAKVEQARRALERLRARAREHRGAPITRDEIAGWIAEGRR